MKLKTTTRINAILYLLKEHNTMLCSSDINVTVYEYLDKIRNGNTAFYNNAMNMFSDNWIFVRSDTYNGITYYLYQSNNNSIITLEKL